MLIGVMSEVHPETRSPALHQQTFPIWVKDRTANHPERALFEGLASVTVQVPHGTKQGDVAVHALGKTLHEAHLIPTVPYPALLEVLGVHTGEEEGSVKGFWEVVRQASYSHAQRMA
jgi:hypothetical protein